MPVRRRRLLSVLLTSPVLVAAACFDDEKLTEISAPTTTDHFLLTVKAEGAIGSRERGQFLTRVAFAAPDTWEVWTETPGFPAHVILSGSRAWEAVAAGWRPYRQSDLVRAAFLGGVLAFENFRRDLRSAGTGPRYAGEATRRYVLVTGDTGERIKRAQENVGVPGQAAATVNATFKGSTVRAEIHVGVESRLVHFYRLSTAGPNLQTDASNTFDYITPVSISVPS